MLQLGSDPLRNTCRLTSDPERRCEVLNDLVDALVEWASSVDCELRIDWRLVRRRDSAELGDFWLSEYISPEAVLTALTDSLPPGLTVQSVQEISQIHGRKLPALVERAEYSVTLPEEIPGLAEKISTVLHSTQIIRSRKGKQYDLRPLIHDIQLELTPEGVQSALAISVYHLPSATGRPDEVLAALDIPPLNTIISRTALVLKPEENL